MKNIIPSLVVAVLAAFNCVAPAAEAGKGPLKAEIIVGKDTYELDPAAAGKDFAEKLRAAEKQGPVPARPPKVNLSLRLSNLDTQPVTINVGADSSKLELDLQGPGAVNLQPRVMMTREFRMGRPVTIEPGKSYDLPIESLSSGMRGITKLSYWTETGEYTLTASYTSGGRGAGAVTAKADPVKLKVVEAGKAPKSSN